MSIIEQPLNTAADIIATIPNFTFFICIPPKIIIASIILTIAARLTNSLSLHQHYNLVRFLPKTTFYIFAIIEIVILKIRG
ncbi:hypothetical protein bcgnr5390_31270 [Bacillus luti]